MAIFAFAETREGELRKVAQEVVTAARTLADGLGTEVVAAVLGKPGTSGVATELGRYGADRVLAGESESFDMYHPEAFTTVIANYLKENGCEAALFPATSLGRDLAPRVAARMGVEYLSEVTGLTVESGQVVATRPKYAGKLNARVNVAAKPAVLALRPNSFNPAENAKAGTVEPLAVSLEGADFGVIVREIRAAAGEKMDVARRR
jgi:electron transfer flavoprotein alpha subunit